MTKLILLLAAALAANGAPAERGPGPQQSPEVVAFTNVTVIPMDRERTLNGQTVIVRGDRIAEIGPANRVRVPEGATQIDGTGKFLMPGLAEMHAHIPGPNNPDFQQRVLLMYLAGGVTTIRGMLGNPQHLTLRDQAARREIWSPTIFTSGPSFNGNSAPDWQTARRMVEEQKQAGYDLLKIHPGLSRQTFDTVAATAQRLGIPFAGHVPAEVGIERALEARYASVDHLDGYVEWLAGAPVGTNAGFFGFGVINQVQDSRIPEIVRRTRAAGVWVAPTQTLMETMGGGASVEEMLSWPGMQYLPQQMTQGWATNVRNNRQQNSDQAAWRHYLDVRHALIKQLHDGGVGILLASDAPQWMNPPGFSALRELETYVLSGLTPYQALQTGTSNVGRYFRAENEFGTVATGRRADLVLLDANPLTDIANVYRQAGVMVRGRWLPREEIQRRLGG